MQKVRIITRGSDLALRQTSEISRALEGASIGVEVLTTKSIGDINNSSPIYDMGSDGVFVSSLNKAVLDEEADIAVHSAKDMPSFIDPGLDVIYFSKRGDPHDFFVSKTPLNEFRGTIGTSSVRRKSYISLLAKDVKFSVIRGNINTRINKCLSGEYDATVVAKVALDRLGLNPPGFVFSERDLPPDPNQGFIAVVARKGDPIADFFKKIQDPVSLWEASAERRVLRELGLGCNFPVSLRGKFPDKKMYFSAVIDDSRADMDLDFSEESQIKGSIVKIGDTLGK
ncbi:MAG: hydroxymethylbilane synthase [Thermoplasmatales archaeon]|nr:hydroxymethylbilane synthase [Thermoplasmatales archaeon]MCW6171029.1 hydroxymethylbilane synthase [Thermoplasmatales archaeon]